MATGQLEGMRIAVLAADGFEQVELTKPVETFEDEGAIVEIVSLREGSIRGMNLLVPGKKVEVDRTVGSVSARDYDALLIPGGFINPDFLRQSEAALDFVRAFDRASKPIAVICHAPWVLVSAGLVRDRTLTSWPGFRDDVRNAGGVWRDEAVVRDGNWVASRGPQDIPKFTKAAAELFAEYVPVGHRRGPRLDEREEGSSTGRWIAGGLALAGVAYAASRVRGDGGSVNQADGAAQGADGEPVAAG